MLRPPLCPPPVLAERRAIPSLVGGDAKLLIMTPPLLFTWHDDDTRLYFHNLV